MNQEAPTIADDLLPTRATLLSRLKAWDDQEGWTDFFNTYWRLIYNVAAKAGLGDAAAQDVVQETIIAVAKGIRDFEYDRRTGSFKGWLLTITRRRIIDHLRKASCRPVALLDHGSGMNGGDPLEIEDEKHNWQQVWDDEWERNLLEVALENVKAKAKARQFQIFDCFVVKGWPMAEVTAKLRVNMGQVYFAKCKIILLLQSEVRVLRRRCR